MSKIARLSLLLGLSIVGGSACLTGRAQTPAERPALDVPAPPDRVVPQVPPPEPPLPAIEPVEDLGSGAKPTPPARSKPPAKPPQDPPKPDIKPDPPATEAAPPPAQNPPPAPQLKLPENADPGVMSRQIRDTVERTRRMLGGTDRTKLTALRQKAFDDAQGFIKQAEDALNQKNLVFAKECAEKAERLAKEVQTREPGLLRHHNGVDHVNDAVRLVHIRDRDRCVHPLLVAQPQLVVLPHHPQGITAHRLQRCFSFALACFHHQRIRVVAPGDDVIRQERLQLRLVLGLQQHVYRPGGQLLEGGVGRREYGERTRALERVDKVGGFHGRDQRGVVFRLHRILDDVLGRIHRGTADHRRSFLRAH